ncbi:hypothetical protein ABPG74_022155 [Tetrahymena malaccensis]
MIKIDEESQSVGEKSYISGIVNPLQKLTPLAEITLAEKFFPTKVEKNVMQTIKAFSRKDNQDVEMPELIQHEDHVQVQLGKIVILFDIELKKTKIIIMQIVANNFKIIISGFNCDSMGDKQKEKQRRDKQIENIKKAIMNTESNKFITDITVMNCKMDVFHIINMLCKKVPGFKDKMIIKILGCSKSVLNIMMLKRFIYSQRRDIRVIELNQVQLHTENSLDNLYSGNFIMQFIRQKLILSRDQAVRILFLEDYLKPQILPQINQINITLQPLIPLKIMDTQQQKWEQVKYENALLDLEEELMAHILMRNNLNFLFEIARGYTIDENTFNSKKGLQYTLDTLQYNESSIQEITFINLYKPNLSIFKIVISKLRNLKLKSICFVNVPLLIDHLIIVKNLLWWNKNHLQQIVFGGNHMNETEFCFLLHSKNLDILDFKSLNSLQIFDNDYVIKSQSYLKVMKQFQSIVNEKKEKMDKKQNDKTKQKEKSQKKEIEAQTKNDQIKQDQKENVGKNDKNKETNTTTNLIPNSNQTQINITTQNNVTQIDEQDLLKDQNHQKMLQIIDLMNNQNEEGDNKKDQNIARRVESQAVIEGEVNSNFKNNLSISIQKTDNLQNQFTDESPKKDKYLGLNKLENVNAAQLSKDNLPKKISQNDLSLSNCNIEPEQEGNINSVYETEKIQTALKYKKEDFTQKKKMINSHDYRHKIRDNQNQREFNKQQKKLELQQKEQNKQLQNKQKAALKQDGQKIKKKIQFDPDLNKEKEPKNSLLQQIQQKLSKKEARKKSKQFYQFQNVDKLRGEVQDFYQIECDELFRAENEDSLTAIIKNHYLQKDYNLKLDLTRVNLKKCSQHTENYLIDYICQSKRLEEVILVQYNENFAFTLSSKIKEFNKTFEVFELSFKLSQDSIMYLIQYKIIFFIKIYFLDYKEKQIKFSKENLINFLFYRQIQQEYFCYLLEAVLLSSKKVVIKNLDIKDNQLIIDINEILRKLEENNIQCCIELDGMQINESFITQDLVVQMITSFMRQNVKKTLSWKNVIKNSWMAYALDEALHNDNSQMGFQSIILDGNIFTDESLYTILRRNSQTLKELRLVNIFITECISQPQSQIDRQDVLQQNSKQKEISGLNDQDSNQNNGTGEDSNSNIHNIYGNSSDERKKKKKLFTDFSQIFGLACSLILADEELNLNFLNVLDLSGSIQQNYITFICAILVKSPSITEIMLKGSEEKKYSVLKQSDLEYLSELLYEMRLVKKNQLKLIDISYNTEIEQAPQNNKQTNQNIQNSLANFIEALLRTQEQSIQKLYIRGRNDEGKNMITDWNVGLVAKAFSKKKVKSMKEIDISFNTLFTKKSLQDLGLLLNSIFESSPNLQLIRMVGKEKESMINDQIAEEISKILDLGICQELRCLDFSQNLAIPTEQFKKLVLSLIFNCSKLECLNLAGSNSHVMLTNEKAEILINILEDNVDFIQNIKEVDLSRNVALSARVLGELVSSILINCNHLEVLRLRGYQSFSMIENEKARAVANAMQCLATKNTSSISSNLTTINFTQMLASQKNKNRNFAVNNTLGTNGSQCYFRILDISLNDIDAGPLNILFKSLLENKSVKIKQINKSRTLDIKRHHSSYQKQLMIDQDIVNNEQTFSYQDIVNTFGGKIFPSLQEVIITEIALINPNVLENFTKTIFAGSFQSLKKLGLVGSPKMQVLDDERVEMLSQIFDEYHENLQLLEEIDISQNSINTNPLHLLLESIFQCKSVKRLKICGSEQYSMITNARAKALIEFFDCNRNIQQVDLSYNIIDDQMVLTKLLQNIIYNNYQTIQTLDLYYPNYVISSIYIETLSNILQKFDQNQVLTELNNLNVSPIPSQSPKSKRRAQQFLNLQINPGAHSISNFGNNLDSPNTGMNQKSHIFDISPSLFAQSYNPHFNSPNANKKPLLPGNYKNIFENEGKLQKRGSEQIEKINQQTYNRQNNTLEKQNSLNNSPSGTNTTLNDKKQFQLNLLKIEGSSNSNSEDLINKQSSQINQQSGSQNQNQQSNLPQQNLQNGLKQILPYRKESDDVTTQIKKFDSNTEQDIQQTNFFTNYSLKEQDSLPTQPDLQKHPSSTIANFFSNFLNLNSNQKALDLENSANKLPSFQEISIFIQGCRQEKLEYFRKVIRKCSKVQLRVNTNYRLSCILPTNTKNNTTQENLNKSKPNTPKNNQNVGDPDTLQTLSDTFYLDKLAISQLDLSSCIEKIYWFMQNKKTLIVKRESLEEMPLLAYCFSFNKNFKLFKLESLFTNYGMTTLFVNELFLKTCRSVLPIKPDSTYLHTIILNANFFKILEFIPNQLEHLVFPSSALNPGFECIKDGTFILSIQSYCQHIMSLKSIQLEYEFNQEDPSYYYLNEKELIQKLLIMPPTIIRTKPKSNLNFLKALYSILYDSYYFESCEIDYNETSALNNGIAVSLIEKAYQMDPSKKIGRFTFFIKKMVYSILDLVISNETIYKLDQQVIQLNNDILNQKVYGIGFKEILIIINILQLFTQFSPALFSDINNPNGKISPIAYFIFAGFAGLSFMVELLLYLGLLRYVSHLIPGLYVTKSKGVVNRISNSIKKFLMNIKMFNYKILRCGIQLFQSVIARYDTFSEVSFIVACFQKKYYLYAYISVGILVFNLMLNYIYFLRYLFRKRKIQRVLNTDNIIQYYKIAALTECSALSEVLDQMCPYNVKHLPDWCIFRGWRNQSINSHILNYMQKFLLKNLPQIILQILFLEKSAGTQLNTTVIISMSTSILSFFLSFLTFLTIRPSSITQIDFNELAAKKQIELISKYKMEEYQANQQFKYIFPQYFTSNLANLPFNFGQSLHTLQNNIINHTKQTERGLAITSQFQKNSLKNLQTIQKNTTIQQKTLKNKKTSIQYLNTPNNITNQNNNSTFQKLRNQKNSIYVELSRLSDKSNLQGI